MKNNFNFIFVRHGKTDYNTNINDYQDLSLNSEGIDQIKKIHLKIKANFDLNKILILSSPLTRALETAKIISDSFQPKLEIKIYEDLRELFYGNSILHPESMENFNQRIKSIIQILHDTYISNDYTILIVSHQNVFRVLSTFLANDRHSLDYGGICYFKILNENSILENNYSLNFM